MFIKYLPAPSVLVPINPMPDITKASRKEKKRRSSMTCLSCRKRKVKCNINEKYPCSACTLLEIECVKATVDKRKIRSESECVNKLELRLKMYEEENLRIRTQLEGIAHAMKELSNINKTFTNKENEVVSPFNNNTFDKGINDCVILPENVSNNFKTKIYMDKAINLDEKYPTPICFKEFNNRFLSVYGPTSVFDNISVAKSKDYKEIEEIRSLKMDSNISEYIKLFFRWQYPDIHIFIFREAFLLDFFHSKDNSPYCSIELIYAICAFGVLMSDNIEKQQKSLEFYDKSRSLCFRNYFKPSICLLQCFLLLGLYDIYNGKNDSGWILSGIAMRMGYSIGLQLNPKELSSEKEPNTKNELGIKIRSRIFWATYTVDHFIGLLLGRPSSIKMNDTTIEETIELPDIAWIHEYSFEGLCDTTKCNAIRIGDPLRATVNLLNITEKILNDVFNNKEKQIGYLEKLLLIKKYNKEIIEWKKSLPTDLSWKSSDMEIIAKNPTLLTFKLLYYIAVLCLNRPFLVAGISRVSDDFSASFKKICSSAINDLAIAIKSFTQTHGYEKCSALIIYCCVISISVLLRSVSDRVNECFQGDPLYKYKVLLFMSTLSECSNIWGLGGKAFELIRSKLMQDYKIDINVELATFDHFQAVDLTSNFELDSEEEENSDIENYKIDTIDENQINYINPELTFSLEDSFGGPPIFMTSNIWNLENIFEEGSINSINYEL